MIELYSIRDVSRILTLPESRLRYWQQVGFVGPTVRKGGRFFYTFCDLVAVKTAKELTSAGVSTQAIRKNVDALRKALPEDTHPASRLRICSDGETIVALADDVIFEPIGGQVVMAFTLPTFGEHVVSTLALPRVVPGGQNESGRLHLGPAVPQHVDDPVTEANSGTTAYRHFVEACAAADADDLEQAEHLFRLALDLEPNMAAALTNLGNLVYRAGELDEARRLYERALEHDPSQAEARYNLANLYEDLGEIDLAIAELRRVCMTQPEFPDAHYNLGIMLAQLGGTAQARNHLERYLQLDGASDWSSHARTYLEQLSAA